MNIIESITSITLNNTEINEYEIEKHISPYSNTKIPIYKLKIDDKYINRSNKYRIKYNCVNCKETNVVSLTQFLRKINKKENKTCKHCRNKDEKKRKDQSIYMIERYKHDKIKKDKIKKDTKFDDMSECFKDKYTKKYLTKTEFDNVKHKIISINGEKKMWKKYDYLFARKINNQTRFNPYLYDTQSDTYIKLVYIKWKCDNCDKHFINRDLFIQKNQRKILCKDCKLCNKIFKIKSTYNINKTKILYQSKLELLFIDWCNKNDIVIINGPKIKYDFNGKSRIYKLDFALPELNMLIEIKDNHCWHNEQVKNGKWRAKEDATLSFLKRSKKYKTFDLVFPNNLNSIKKQIIDKI